MKEYYVYGIFIFVFILLIILIFYYNDSLPLITNSTIFEVLIQSTITLVGFSIAIMTYLVQKFESIHIDFLRALIPLERKIKHYLSSGTSSDDDDDEIKKEKLQKDMQQLTVLKKEINGVILAVVKSTLIVIIMNFLSIVLCINNIIFDENIPFMQWMAIIITPLAYIATFTFIIILWTLGQKFVNSILEAIYDIDDISSKI